MTWRCTKTLLALLLPLSVLGAACGDDDDAADTASAGEEAAASEGTGDSEDSDDEEAGADAEEPAEGASTAGASGTATLTLANGEEFEFSILCSLEPQTAAGQEILFSITSYDEPYGFDATKFGEDAAVPGMTSIDVYNSESYEAVWSAQSIGGDAELELDGSDITGSATFFEGDEGLGDGVEGELSASC